MKVIWSVITLLLFNVSVCYPSSGETVKINATGETTIDVKSSMINTRVKIRTREIQDGKSAIKNLGYLPSTCTHSAKCSIVDNIEIFVNNKKIFIPHSLISDLGWLNTGEVRIDGKNMALLLSEGDGAESYFIKIDFDEQRVKRMSLYADNSMKPERLLSETEYHLVTDD